MIHHKIAILATGDEVTQGSILNTNTQAIAHHLFSHGLEPQWNMAVPDDVSAIECALDFLAQEHNIIITIGGLGPTSDDKTRFAIANYVKEPLVIHDPSFAALTERYQKFDMAFTTLAQQQALFPQNAEILPNKIGSANGCFVVKNNVSTFILPGPPRECLPMFEAEVLPRLVTQYASDKTLFQWKVFGIAEGKIAEQMDNLLKPHMAHCRTSFRWNYPYVDCKVLLNQDTPDKEDILTQLNQLLSPYQLDPDNHTATERLSHYLNHYQLPVLIQDYATGGILESRIHTIANHHQLFFREPCPANSVIFRIEGLQNYWEGGDATQSELMLTTPAGTETFQIPFRKVLLEEYAAELIAHHLYLKLADI